MFWIFHRNANEERNIAMKIMSIPRGLVFLSCLLSISGCGSADSKPADQAATQGASREAPGNVSAQEETPAGKSRSAAVIAHAEENNRFLFLLFLGGEADRVAAMKDSLARGMATLGEKADTAFIDAADPAEAETVRKYGIGARGGLPMVLALAPNGVVTGGYPGTVSTEQLVSATQVSELMLKVLKPLQEQKVALVALQNAATKFSEESWAGVSDFANDADYKQMVSAIKADPAAAGSREFVEQCRLVAPVTEATVVVLLPPGRIGSVLTGKLTKNDVLKSLQSCTAGSGCCSDRRFKQNVEPVESALQKVTRLQGVTFVWNRADFPGRFFPEGARAGLIAQDVEKVVPEVVHTDKEGYKKVEYDKLTAVLIEAVKELNGKIDAQDLLIQAQNKRIKALEGR